MSRKIVISKYEGNTVYSVNVFDSYGTEHHLGYIHISDIDNLTLGNDYSLRHLSEKIWEMEVKPEKNLLSNAISRCIEIDKENGLEPNLD